MRIPLWVMQEVLNEVAKNDYRNLPKKLTYITDAGNVIQFKLSMTETRSVVADVEVNPGD